MKMMNGVDVLEAADRLGLYTIQKNEWLSHSSGDFTVICSEPKAKNADARIVEEKCGDNSKSPID